MPPLILCAVGVAIVGWIDYLSGVELKTYPLYFVPVGWAAWKVGRRAGRLLSVLAALVWEWSNQLAGLHYAHAWTWWWNTVAQLLAFLTIAELLSTLATQLVRERAAARSDPLTGLLNVRGFHELLRGGWALALRHGRPVTVMYLDLDGFKAVNDRLGHDAGDALLRLTADRLRSGVRVTDLVARCGGDEFVLAFPELGKADAAQVGETLLERLHTSFREGGHPVRASVGVLTVLDCAKTSPEQAFAQADSLMYVAKRTGGDRCQHECWGEAALQLDLARTHQG